jgi:hypothetical protein
MKFEQTNHEPSEFFSHVHYAPHERWSSLEGGTSCASEMNLSLRGSSHSFMSNYMALPLPFFASRDITRGQTENLTCTAV